MPNSILLVEDQPATAEALVAQLKLMGYEPAWAVSGEAALARAGARRFSALLIDHLLPGELTGLDLLRRLRDLPGYGHVPALLLTATDRRTVHELEHAVEDLGPAGVIRKPVDLPEMLLRLALLRVADRIPPPIPSGDTLDAASANNPTGGLPDRGDGCGGAAEEGEPR
jgi:two-component system OmpR family response regulator